MYFRPTYLKQEFYFLIAVPFPPFCAMPLLLLIVVPSHEIPSPLFLFASFQPDEAGEWRIHVTYDGQDIDHSPFKCMVFNPRAIFVSTYQFCEVMFQCFV